MNIYYVTESAESTETTESSGLELDPEVLNKRKEQHSSLEDLYKYSVFSKEFKENIEYVNKKEANEMEKSFEKVFVGEKNDVTDEVFETVISAPSKTVITNDYSNHKTNANSGLISVLFIGLGMSIAFVALLGIDKLRKLRKDSKKELL